MHEAERERLRTIRTFPSLVKYLRDELGWPIDSENFEDLTFDYEPEELGIDRRNAAKIKEIKQLRPLESDQPWGIFFVKFEPKRLPVVALRRILGKLVFHKRASADRSERPSWNMHDLLFISSYGESDDRQISLAHFSEDSQMGNLATLKVLGWDGEDTGLHLDHVHHELHSNLRWPPDPDATDQWREKWSAAFTLRHREVITTAKALATELADLARRIRKKVNAALEVETERGKLRKVMKAFRESLIHDLDDDDFADMYAQTIAYGLLTARVSCPAGLAADDVAQMVPITNPFLREMMETFLNIGGRKRGANGESLDFDELGVNDVVETLRAANMEAILRDFGNRNPDEDPVIRFYEDFLREYDADKRMKRGVFYTPRPVVSYIVRSVHELLQTEFGLEDGLADTTTWGEMAERDEGLTIPEGTDPDSPFVMILDPATGTATFLVEVIDVIYRTMYAKWQKLGHTELFHIPELWNEYVPKHLLPRLHGYEIMMAPYAIAHMKLGLKLVETGYRFESGERAHIYLSNSLEAPPPREQQVKLSDWFPALAHESQAVNSVKRKQRFTVILGNPPYASLSANLTNSLRKIVEPFRYVDGERIRERSMLQFEKNIQDDYVKFFALALNRVLDAAYGICAMITNHSYLDGPTLRGLRWNLVERFSRLRFLDLHGNSNKNEIPPEGVLNENVFDIRQGVAIAILARHTTIGPREVLHSDCWGTREEKYAYLSRCTSLSGKFAAIHPKAPYFYIVTSGDGEDTAEWEFWPSITDIFVKRSTGTETGFDSLLVGFSKKEVTARLARFCSPSISEGELLGEFDCRKGHAHELFLRRAELRSASDTEFKPFQLRAYDYRTAFLRKTVLKTNSFNVMRDLGPMSPGLVTTRQTKERFTAFSVSSFCGHKVTSSYDRSYVFPLFTASEDTLPGVTVPCISSSMLSRCGAYCQGASGIGEDVQEIAKSVFSYVLAVMNAPGYLQRYDTKLKRDWPRVPMPGTCGLYKALVALGSELAAVQLMEAPRLDKPIAKYHGPPQPRVISPSFGNSTVWLDRSRTYGFNGVPEDVWNFHVGGYQVCKKWLKDRQAKSGKNAQPGQVLTQDDIAHYQKIVVALSETIRIMAEIDEVIDRHGGWPDAFVTEPVEDDSK